MTAQSVCNARSPLGGATWCQFAPMQFAVAASVANKVPSGVQWLKTASQLARGGAKN